MNDGLNITKGLSVEVRVLMEGGREIFGRFFLADQARHHYGKENLLDLLNQPERPFVPLEQGGEYPITIIGKSNIVALRPNFPNSSGWPAASEGDEQAWPAARIELPDLDLVGRAYTGDMQPSRHRLVDLLNQGNPFLLFETDEGPWIINSRHVRNAVPLD